jgi:MOSC domain-containing protein YiiM
MEFIMTNNIGKVLKLFISLDGTSNRVQKDNIRVDKNGVVLDKFYNKDINRSILLTSKKAYDMVKEKDIRIKYSALGENILIDYNPYDLPIGTKIKIGQVILQITQHCTLCKSLKNINDCVPSLLKEDRGVFAKVIEEGLIFKKDTISIID